MPSPKEYFDNPREADLANRVWEKSAILPGHWKLQKSHEIFNDAAWPWVNKRIIWARDWITAKREQDGAGGIVSLNAEFHSNFTATEIANVEHFYVAALVATIGGPTGGPMLNAIGDPFWELIVGPLRAAKAYGVRAVMKSIKSNWNQLKGPDAAGTRFGTLYTFNEFRELISKT